MQHLLRAKMQLFNLMRAQIPPVMSVHLDIEEQSMSKLQKPQEHSDKSIL